MGLFLQNAELNSVYPLGCLYHQQQKKKLIHVVSFTISDVSVFLFIRIKQFLNINHANLKALAHKPEVINSWLWNICWPCLISYHLPRMLNKLYFWVNECEIQVIEKANPWATLSENVTICGIIIQDQLEYAFCTIDCGRLLYISVRMNQWCSLLDFCFLFPREIPVFTSPQYFKHISPWISVKVDFLPTL